MLSRGTYILILLSVAGCNDATKVEPKVIERPDPIAVDPVTTFTAMFFNDGQTKTLELPRRPAHFAPNETMPPTTLTIVRNLVFDVKKTDSLITPFIGTAGFTLREVNHYGDSSPPSKPDRPLDFAVQLQYGYKDHTWEFTGAECQLEDRRVQDAVKRFGVDVIRQIMDVVTVP